MAAPTPPFRSCRIDAQPRMALAQGGERGRGAVAGGVVHDDDAVDHRRGIVSSTVPMSFSSLYAGTTTTIVRPSNMAGYCIGHGAGLVPARGVGGRRVSRDRGSAARPRRPAARGALLPVRRRAAVGGLAGGRRRPRARARRDRVLHRRHRDHHRVPAPDLRRQPGQLPPRGRPAPARRRRATPRSTSTTSRATTRTATKEQAVDWNELGVRYARVLSGGAAAGGGHGVDRPHHARLPGRLRVDRHRRARRDPGEDRRRGASSCARARAR